jgi:hypothetical protein
MAIKSPEVMRAWETDDWDSGPSHPRCDGCNKELHGDSPVMVIENIMIVCLVCVRWAIPQMEELEREK